MNIFVLFIRTRLIRHKYKNPQVILAKIVHAKFLRMINRFPRIKTHNLCPLSVVCSTYSTKYIDESIFLSLKIL